MSYRELAGVLNQLAGTTNLEAQEAANVWAGSKGLELTGALNQKNGTVGLEFDGACAALNSYRKGLSGLGALNDLAGNTLP